MDFKNNAPWPSTDKETQQQELVSGPFPRDPRPIHIHRSTLPHSHEARGPKGTAP